MWVEMIQTFADAERSLAPGQRGMFPNDVAEKMIADGAAVEVDGPEGERTDRTEVRTRPVPQPPRGGRRTTAPKKVDGQGDGGGDGAGKKEGQQGPKDPAGQTPPPGE